ncbi:MAG: right-handed parallel beta-helix repeat-containing protein [Bacteroidota bacterium]
MNQKVYSCNLPHLPSILLGMLLLLLGMLPQHSFAQDCNCDITLDSTTTFASGLATAYQPGDTICIMAGQRHRLMLRDWAGTAQDPLVFINCGGQVDIYSNDFHYGISMVNVQHVKLLGNGDPSHPYGIRVSKGNKGDGISITGISTNIEIAHTEIDSTFSNAILCRAAPTCDSATHRGNFLMEDIKIHDNYIHDVNGEGIAVGSIFYTSGRTVYCGGVKHTYAPHLIDGVKIYQNIVAHTGLEGIQVFSAPSDVDIYDNEVTFYGLRAQGGENTGIYLGAGATGHIFRNTLKDGLGTAIEIQGVGNTRVDNNLIVRAGANYAPTNPILAAHGIFVNDHSTLAGNYFQCINNTIIEPKTDGIRFSSVVSSNNIISNNLIVAPGAYLQYETDNTSAEGNDAYVFLSNGTTVDMASNTFAQETQNLGLVDPTQDNFALLGTSSLIDAGTNINGLNISTDIQGIDRSTNLSADVGAFEFQAAPTNLNCGCDVVIPLNVQTANGANYSYAPGDTVCILGGARNHLELVNWTGSQAEPVVFINCGGPVELFNNDQAFGLHLESLQHVEMTALSTTTHPYGITIKGTQTGGSGILLDGYTQDVAISHIEIKDIDGAGLKAYNEPDCNSPYLRGNYTMSDIKVHHLYVHDVQQQGMILGSPNYTGYQASCSPKALLPHLMANLDVHHNQVERTGYEGIMINSSPSNSDIHHNEVRTSGLRAVDKCMAGIHMGGGTAGDVHGNAIYDTKGDGIVVEGLGDNKIYNNIIARAGTGQTTHYAHGIHVVEVAPIYRMGFHVMHNTIVSPKNRGIFMEVTTMKTNKIVNNIVANPGELEHQDANAHEYAPTEAFIYLKGRTGAKISHNLLELELDDIHFTDHENDNYNLLSISPAVDEGMNLSYAGVSQDFNDSTRSNVDIFDIGALEFGSNPSVKACDCAVTIDTSMHFANGNQYAYQPGDTICIAAGTRGFLRFMNWSGTAEDPLVFVNLGGTVTIQQSGKQPGLRFANVQHARIIGNGLSQTRKGFVIKGQGQGGNKQYKRNGVEFTGLTKDIVVEQVEVYGVYQHGIFIRGNISNGNTMENIVIRRNYIHDIEGMGIQVFAGGNVQKQINGGDPATLQQMKNILIEDNEVLRTGMTGIRVVGVGKEVIVRQNKVIAYGGGQRNGRNIGIHLGGGVWDSKVFNNKLSDGYGTGIILRGAGSNHVYNNLIVEPGKNSTSTRKNRSFHGIQVADRNTSTIANTFILNNTIVSPAGNGIRMLNAYGDTNLVANNLVVDPGAWELKWQRYHNRAFLTVKKNASITAQRNFYHLEIDSIKFTNPTADDYTLLANSPAIDGGLNVDSLGIHEDIAEGHRFYGTSVDRGAYETLMANHCNCDIVLDPEVTFASGYSYDYAPGDTICITAGSRATLQLRDWYGTAEQPLVFMNSGGLVKIGNDPSLSGLSIIDSKHLQLTGYAIQDITYGIKVANTGAGNGLTVYGQSSDIEIDHIEISHPKFSGIMIKADPTATLETSRDSFTMRNIIVRDNYIHHVPGEGLYIGSSAYKGRPMTIGDTTVTVLPHVIRNLQVYNNIVEHTGWDGIQISSADSSVNVYHNVVRDYGEYKTASQQAGILIGGGTTGNFYNNEIHNGSGSGIELLGIGDNYVYNNIITNAGYNYYPDSVSLRAYGIFTNDVVANEGTGFHILNNTIVNPKTDGIRMYSTETTNNEIINNLIVAPGAYDLYLNDGILATDPEDAYINLGTGVTATVANNVQVMDIDSAGFTNYANENYTLTSTSPAIDQGQQVVTASIFYDFAGGSRQLGNQTDAGAFEYVPVSNNNARKRESNNTKSSTTPALENDSQVQVTAFPNPTTDFLNIERNDFEGNEIMINVYDQSGKVVMNEVYYGQNGNFAQMINVSDLPLGVYVLGVNSEQNTSHVKFVKK